MLGVRGRLWPLFQKQTEGVHGAGLPAIKMENSAVSCRLPEAPWGTGLPACGLKAGSREGPSVQPSCPLYDKRASLSFSVQAGLESVEGVLCIITLRQHAPKVTLRRPWPEGESCSDG